MKAEALLPLRKATPPSPLAKTYLNSSVVPHLPFTSIRTMDPQDEPNPNTNDDPSSDSSSNLLFINSTGSARGRPRDESTKRQIRQHVMRDIGKARRKPPRNPQVNLRVRSPTAIAGPSSASFSSAATGLSDPRSGGSQLAQLSLLQQHAGGLRLPSPPRPFWDQHPLAMMELDWGMDAFAAYGLAFAFTVSDFDQARVHLNGLKLLIATRGGIESLSNEQETLMMIFWVDTIASLVFDQRPGFPMPSSLIPPLPNEESPEILKTLAHNLSNLCPNLYAHHLDIVSAFQDIWSVSETIQSKLDTWGDDLWQEEIYLGTRLNPIAYRLLDSPTHSHQEMPCSILEALRLGALLWILGVKQKAQAYPASPAPYITRLLHLLQSQNLKNLVSASPYFIPFQLWLLFLCATMTLTTTKKTAALQMVAHIMVEQGWAWEEVMANMRQLPWINGLDAYGTLFVAEA
ncbi:hypothetical protein ACHAQJ_002970 [Trichoderma viride]